MWALATCFDRTVTRNTDSVPNSNGRVFINQQRTGRRSQLRSRGIYFPPINQTYTVCQSITARAAASSSTCFAVAGKPHLACWLPAFVKMSDGGVASSGWDSENDPALGPQTMLDSLLILTNQTIE